MRFMRRRRTYSLASVDRQSRYLYFALIVSIFCKITKNFGNGICFLGSFIIFVATYKIIHEKKLYKIMVKVTKEAALEYHHNGRPGKIEVKPTKPYSTQTDLSLAYSPGVAYPCLEIQQNPDDVYKYTTKGNLVAVISNGTAVLGLGNIGAMSGKPVMEGKGLLFKIYGGVDVFDIEVNEQDPDKFCEAVEKIAPTFGGINLEDIKAPECFAIEERLKRTLDIPVMHDDQHGTAIISAAGLKNALEVAGKDISKVKLVVNGAGAAAISCTKMYVALGVKKENIVMLDSKGVITSDRENLTPQKALFATDRRDVHTLEEAINEYISSVKDRKSVV